ncbi:unnamed protein product [Arabidopsis thaliana]|uniref:Putative F-box protein At2g19630 n=3 Tax=Arabidopsis TaxID=3701 RepID=FB113_ARATH|nr:F-box and associated interaction domains-containing protein [Arabidopsis thaliana]Q9ZUN0.1 RecName: Full=Putative F-box protein At2g19630 [Arabidopsis thaliana]KAG7641341.1 F-box domain [Arabidopsis suecica]AAD10161.1 hypothetical protein [Arabidopsis thaliana]AEC06904.1 F-box and associated interaction domains-containing protein [Arabidopsis thaliana]CAA0366519.1 unnamed protein product [Arabidopsis thaliana]VYS52859.1 unnamed protein product [Arabidopsis thaliana]|eukprot:NP_179553.1 F-box and associated interaction domains-containing protein [Arabidopsis thaliana]
MKTSLRLEDGTKNSLQIPIDLIIEIFLRLSVNSIARCRCVSKQWASTLSRPYFTELFLTRSLARPKLLFAYRKGSDYLFLSSPQLQNPDDDHKKSSPVVVNYHMHHILTLGSGNMSWRTIQCCIPHRSFDGGICIDGLIYYYAGVNNNDIVIVCFDVRSEEFRFIIGALHHGSLINYNGKLSLYLPSTVYSRFNGVIRSIKLWVLEDAKRQEWSEHTYILPAMHDIMKTTDLRCVGMTQTKEFVFWSIKGMRFYVFYYNIERNTIKKVEMQGMEAFKESNVYTFLDHVEDVKLMQFF